MSNDTEYDLNWITSVDDHIIEPPNVWVDRLPAKYHDVWPRVIEENGSEYWVYENTKSITGGLGASAGRRPEDITATGFPYSEMRAGCYDAKARLEDMNEAHILASLNFPSSLAGFAGQRYQLGVSDPDAERPRIRPEQYLAAGLLVVADLVAARRVAPEAYLRRAVSEIERAETQEMP